MPQIVREFLERGECVTTREGKRLYCLGHLSPGSADEIWFSQLAENFPKAQIFVIGQKWNGQLLTAVLHPVHPDFPLHHHEIPPHPLIRRKAIAAS